MSGVTRYWWQMVGLVRKTGLVSSRSRVLGGKLSSNAQMAGVFGLRLADRQRWNDYSVYDIS